MKKNLKRKFTKSDLDLTVFTPELMRTLVTRGEHFMSEEDCIDI
jgi:hypothetical protein